MQFPLDFTDVCLWLAFMAILLLIAIQLVSPYYGKTNLLINKKRLKNVTLIISILFLMTIAIRIIEIARSG